jgi:hypothetical protein
VAGGREIGQRGFRVLRDLAAGARDRPDAHEAVTDAEAGDDLVEHRLPQGPAGHDGVARGGPLGLATRRFEHPHHRDRRDLAQGEQAGIAEAGEEDRVAALAVLREGVEGRVAGDGQGRPAGDVGGAETRRGRDEGRRRTRHRPDLRGQEFGHRGAGVRIEQKDPHGALAWREPAGRPGDGRHEAGLRW